MNARQIKEQINIVDYLRGIGIEPARATARGFLYHCPWREDLHPSLSVSRDGRTWHDFSSDEKGSIIDLLMKLQNTNDLTAICAAFDNFSFHQSGTLDKQKEKENLAACNSFSSFNVLPLRSRGLFAYMGWRGIPSEVAKRYCQEAHYTFGTFGTNENYMYAVAFGNDGGGYELRSKYFKGSKAPKAITTYLDLANAPCVVFEGFIDFLSFVTMEGTRKHNYCILNSVTNANQAIEKLSVFRKVYLCLDNDEAGRKTAEHIRANLLGDVEDISERFSPYKDLNDFLLKKAP